MKKTKIIIPLALLLASNSWSMGEKGFFENLLGSAMAAGRSLLASAAPDLPAELLPEQRVMHFIHAAARGNVELAQSLLSYVDVNAQEQKYQACALTVASQNGHLPVVLFLLEQEGSNCDLRTSFGHTPLYLASRRGHLVIAKALVEAKADPTIPDTNGFLPLHAACENGDPAMVSMLIDAAPHTIDVSPDGIMTPLNIALLKKKVDIVPLLLEKKARYRAHDGALKSRHLEIQREEDENPAGPEESEIADSAQEGDAQEDSAEWDGDMWENSGTGAGNGEEKSES